MKNTLLVLASLTALVACSNSKKGRQLTAADKRIALRADTINVVKMSDTMVIYESTCRGCAYEQSTRFSIADTTGIVKLNNINTADNNPSDMDGGNISKDLIIVPAKTGKTTIKLYKFRKEPATAEDSASFTPYTIYVRN